MPAVWWNYLVIYVSTAAMEGSVCARYSAFSKVHIMQQSLFYTGDHLQQPDKLAMELRTHLSIGYFPAIYLLNYHVQASAVQWLYFMFCIWAFHTLRNIYIKSSIK